MDKIPKKNKMIKDRIRKLRNEFKKYNIDGYIVPKNDEFFSEYSRINRLKNISNFSGSAGFAVILENKSYLFVDGRYSIQSKMESGKNFKIFEIPYKYPKDVLNINKIKHIGYDPNLFTNSTLQRYFG